MEAKNLHHFVSAFSDHSPLDQPEFLPRLVILELGLSSLRDGSVSLLVHEGGVSTVDRGKLAPSRHIAPIDLLEIDQGLLGLQSLLD